MKYANSGQEQLRALEPFVFYKKGRATRELLASSVLLANKTTQLQLFSTTYELVGRLKRWGVFNVEQLNLCRGEKVPTLHGAQQQQQAEISCQLSLEQLIDVASQEGNDNYINLYLNYSNNREFQLQQIPVLIETLTPENQVGSWFPFIFLLFLYFLLHLAASAAGGVAFGQAFPTDFGTPKG